MVDWIKVLVSVFSVYAVLTVFKTVRSYTYNNTITTHVTIYKPINILVMYPTDHRIIRLGNQIFQFASTMGIAHMNGLRAVIACDHYLKTIFDVTLLCINRSKIKEAGKQIHWSERGAGIYMKTAETLGDSKNVLVSGYLQSWRYFNNTKDILKKQLHFKQHILDMAHTEIDKAIRGNHLPINQTHIKVGVHVRRTDMASKSERKSGYSVVDQDYINKSMSIMRSMYKDQNVVFVMCSDDMKWVRSNVQGKDIVYVHTIYAHVDLAVLSLCDAVILSTGTFGWWGAWFSGGPAIYYKNFPVPNSQIGREYNSSDYYPPWWTGL